MYALAGIGPLGVPELIIIAFIVILIFGVGRLPEVGGAVGKGIREFRKATKEGVADDDTTMSSSAFGSDAPAASAGSEAVFCSECGSRNVRGAKFCASCGHGITAPVG